MKKYTIALCALVLVAVLVSSCDDTTCTSSASVNGDTMTIDKYCDIPSPYARIRYSTVMQGKITKGSLTVQHFLSSKTTKFIPATDGKIDGFIAFPFDDVYQNPSRDTDIFMYKRWNNYRNISKSDEKSFPYIVNDSNNIQQSFTFTISRNFEGKIYVFVYVDGYYTYETRNPAKLSLVYGKKLAQELTKQGVDTDEKEPIAIIDNDMESKYIRKFVQAAQAVKDPRLLVIERESGKGKMNITAFGETTTIDADKSYVWEFDRKILEALSKFTKVRVIKNKQELKEYGIDMGR